LAVKIRLARAGAKKAPFYRLVAADSRAPRDGRFIEILGRYNPRTQPSTVVLDLEKVESWLSKGAEPTEAAAKLIAIARGEKSAPQVEEKVSKKAAEKAAAETTAEAQGDTPDPEAVADAAEQAVSDTPEAE